jgi:hypothetical protein
MRELRFKQYGVHRAGGSWIHGTVKDLLRTLPYVLHRHIPPFRILQHLLQHGVPNEIFPDGRLPDGKVQYDAGMSGGAAWTPFELTQEEYDDLVLDLLTEPASNFVVLEAPAKVQTYMQWVMWKSKP